MKPHDLTRQPKTDPIDLYRYRDGLYAVDLLTAAITGLDLFTWLSRNPADQKTLCAHFGITERPTDVMLTLFTAMGYLERRGERFHLTEKAREHLVSDSPWFLGPYYASLKQRPVCQDMLNVLRTGRPANWGSYKDEKEWHLLDIAGGSGIYSCAFVAHHPRLRATVLEKPPVNGVATRCIAQRGFADRVSVVARDMFAEPFPADCDVHLYSNVLHDWDEPLVKQLLKKSFAALPGNGLIVVHDAHINEDKTGPLPVAAYSALLMNITEGKCYSVAEMQGYLQEAGFGPAEYFPTAADRSVMTAAKP